MTHTHIIFWRLFFCWRRSVGRSENFQGKYQQHDRMWKEKRAVYGLHPRFQCRGLTMLGKHSVFELHPSPLRTRNSWADVYLNGICRQICNFWADQRSKFVVVMASRGSNLLRVAKLSFWLPHHGSLPPQSALFCFKSTWCHSGFYVLFSSNSLVLNR